MVVAPTCPVCPPPSTEEYPFFWQVALLDARSRALQHISQIFVSLWWAEIILKAWWIKEQPIKLSPYQRPPFSRVAVLLQRRGSIKKSKFQKTNLLREKFFLTWKWIIALDILTNKRDRGRERWQVGVGKGRTGSTFKHKFVLKCNYNKTIINPHNLQWWGHPNRHVCSGSSQQSQTSKMRHESDNKEQKLRPS